MSTHVDVLVAVAHELELGALEQALQPLSGATAPRAFEGDFAAGHVVAQAVGVGLPAAAAGTAMALARYRPAALVLLGSYGRYPEQEAASAGGSEPGDGGATGEPPIELLVPGTIRALDAGIAAGEAAFPEAMPTTVATDVKLSSQLAARGATKLGSLGVTLAITTDDGLAFRLARSGCRGENLEALGVGLACAQVGVPFAALLGCTNEVGSAGRAQWRANHKRAAAATSRLLLDWLSQR